MPPRMGAQPEPDPFAVADQPAQGEGEDGETLKDPASKVNIPLGVQVFGKIG